MVACRTTTEKAAVRGGSEVAQFLRTAEAELAARPILFPLESEVFKTQQ